MYIIYLVRGIPGTRRRSTRNNDESSSSSSGKPHTTENLRFLWSITRDIPDYQALIPVSYYCITVTWYIVDFIELNVYQHHHSALAAEGPLKDRSAHGFKQQAGSHLVVGGCQTPPLQVEPRCLAGHRRAVFLHGQQEVLQLHLPCPLPRLQGGQASLPLSRPLG